MIPSPSSLDPETPLAKAPPSVGCSRSVGDDVHRITATTDDDWPVSGMVGLGQPDAPEFNVPIE